MRNAERKTTKVYGVALRYKETHNLRPFTSTLLESMRSTGHSLESAIADIIDNSLSADAKSVWINFSWNNGDPWIAIIDDGYGMNQEELENAMRLGSKGPDDFRRSDDLGRFGLGLKTASISQCRRLTVLSRSNGVNHCCELDLDEIKMRHDYDWPVGILDESDVEHRPNLQALSVDLRNRRSGTVVLWETLDKLNPLKAASSKEVLFDYSLTEVRRHLELVFHRYISPERGQKRVKIFMNDDPLEAFDPFDAKSNATQELPEQRFRVEDQPVIVQPYVLPHHSKVSREEYENNAGEGGYLQNQGFYLYRNRRLICWGTWFRLAKREELNKLVRVRIDSPTSLDHLWNIDLKKSTANPAEAIRKELRQIVERISAVGKMVYTQKGYHLSSKIVTIWRRRVVGGLIEYEINREYPLVQRLLQVSTAEQVENIKDLLTLLEKTFPKDTLLNDMGSNPQQVATYEFEADQLERILDVFLALWAPEGKPTQNMLRDLLDTQPFSEHRERTESILANRGIMYE